jgi:hypothetical protein
MPYFGKAQGQADKRCHKATVLPQSKSPGTNPGFPSP